MAPDAPSSLPPVPATETVDEFSDSLGEASHWEPSSDHGNSTGEDSGLDSSPTDEPGDEPKGRGRHVRKTDRNWKRLSLEWLAVLLVAVGVAITVRTFVVQTFFIPSASMEPTLMVGDRILVDKLSYHLHGVGRGDIVVFGRPPGEVAAVKDLVKRVIGLPGDTISSPNGHVWINGKQLNEPYLPKGTITTGIRTQKIPPGYYFVMGDNRGDSSDSRVFGPIARSLIVGHVVFRIWPVTHMGFF